MVWSSGRLGSALWYTRVVSPFHGRGYTYDFIPHLLSEKLAASGAGWTRSAGVSLRRGAPHPHFNAAVISVFTTRGDGRLPYDTRRANENIAGVHCTAGRLACYLGW